MAEYFVHGLKVNTSALTLLFFFFFLLHISSFYQTPSAVTRLRALTEGPEPKMVRVGIRTKGCSGQQYNLEYTTTKAKFDEEVKQDG